MSGYRRTLAGRRDLLAPVAAMPTRYPGLLQSVLYGTAQSRYDLALAFPDAVLRLDADGAVRDQHDAVQPGSFLNALDRAWQAEHCRNEPDDLPFHSGWLLFLGYELEAQIEPRLVLPTDPAMPVALALRCRGAIVVDHQREQTTLIAEAGHEKLLDLLARDLDAPFDPAPLPAPVSLTEDDPARFLDGVARVHEHLLAGHIFQANLSRQWRASYAQPPSPAALYAALRQANPAPFAGLLQQPGWAVISSSPERLVHSRGGVAQVRPIAGTRPRLSDDDDGVRVRELLGHPKERAEHVMLIDLERNDLGRVCQSGSVQVDELMTVESYAHVHHIVSNVRGTLREGVTPGQLIAATFPGGTITGCPKLRCMQIIAALEQSPRGAYTGALGYLDRSGDLDLNILIRTLTQVGNHVSLRAGAGIVADSVASSELAETRAKARGLLQALGVDS